MKKLTLSLYVLLMIPWLAHGQIGEKFEPGFLIDRFGVRYNGFLRLEPGDGDKPGELLFKESRKSKKESYGPDYVTSFKIEKDSFAVLKNIPVPKKAIKADFAKVVMVGSGGSLYFLEHVKSKTSGHATSNHTVTEESERYFATINGNLVMLTQSNFKDFATVVADFGDLSTRIQSRKVKLADLPKVVEEYKTFKAQK